MPIELEEDRWLIQTDRVGGNHASLRKEDGRQLSKTESRDKYGFRTTIPGIQYRIE